MNITFIIFISLVFIVGLFSTHLYRGLIVLLILLPGSQFLGFMNPDVFTVKGMFDIHALIAILIAVTILISIFNWSDLGDAYLMKPMFIFFVFWLYGVLYPVFQGYSSLFYALKSSKEFLTIFSYFAVFLYVRYEKEVRWGWYILIGFGIYYSIIEIVAQVAGSNFLSHMVYDFRREMFFWKVYIPFWPIIIIAFLHFYYSYVLGVQRAFIRMGISIIGILLTFFRSYLLGMAVSVPMIMFFSRLGVVRTLVQGVIVAILISLSVVGISLMSSDSHDSLESLSNHFVISGIEEFGSQSGGALAEREEFAKGRREILEQNPYAGFGFIDKDSSFGREVSKHIYGDMLGFIDKGDVDTALKFGYAGRALLYATVAYLIYLLVNLVRNNYSVGITIKALTTATLSMVFLMVQPVHAALTYSFSLLPLGIALGLLDRERLIYLRETESKK